MVQPFTLSDQVPSFPSESLGEGHPLGDLDIKQIAPRIPVNAIPSSETLLPLFKSSGSNMRCA